MVLSSPIRGLFALLTIGLLTATPLRASAQDGGAAAETAAGQDATPDTDELLSVAETALRLGQYGFAIQAFNQAHKLDPLPERWLDVGDAYFQRFLVKGGAYDRQQAIAYFDGYLDARPDGPRSERVRRALAELEARAQTADDATLAKARDTERAQTRLAIVSPVLGATARIDDGKRHKLPLFVFIKPGKRAVVVSAEGYQDQERQLEIQKGFAYGIRADLDPETAKLWVDSTPGAQFYLDGRYIGTDPLEDPVEVAPGMRRLTIAANGRRLHTEQLQLERGETLDHIVDLDMTRQRIGGIFLASTGGAAIIASVVVGYVALDTENTANDMSDGAVKNAELATSRDLRVVSTLSAGVGLGLSLFGGLLLTFDEPAVSLSPQGPGQAGATLKVAF